MPHYSKQREEWYGELNELMDKSNTGLTEVVYSSLPSLGGIVEYGVGADKLESKEDYLLKIEALIQELDEKRVKVLYDLVSLDYNSVKEEI